MPPDVNESVYAFQVAGADEHPLRAWAPSRASAPRRCEAIIEERERSGPFASLPDLCRRIDLQRVNRRVFEALIRSGSLDRIGPNRATLTAELDRAMHLGEQNSRAMSVGQVDLFGLSAAAATIGRRRLDRGAAPGGRARDAGAVPERPSDHARMSRI